MKSAEHSFTLKPNHHPGATAPSLNRKKRNETLTHTNPPHLGRLHIPAGIHQHLPDGAQRASLGEVGWCCPGHHNRLWLCCFVGWLVVFMKKHVRNLQPGQRFTLLRTGEQYRFIRREHSTPNGTRHVVMRDDPYITSPNGHKESTLHHACHVWLEVA